MRLRRCRAASHHRRRSERGGWQRFVGSGTADPRQKLLAGDEARVVRVQSCKCLSCPRIHLRRGRHAVPRRVSQLCALVWSRTRVTWDYVPYICALPLARTSSPDPAKSPSWTPETINPCCRKRAWRRTES